VGDPGLNAVRLSAGGLPALTFTVIGLNLVPGGTLSGDVTWTKEGSPYVVEGGELVVPAGVTLTIGPGAEVRNSRLRVAGTLKAVGTANSHVTLTGVYTNTVGDSPGPEIDIEYADISGGLVASGPFVSRLIVRNSVIKDAGPIVLWYSAGADSYIERNVFVRCGGIVTSATGDRNVVIRNNSFYDPVPALGGSDSLAIVAQAQWGTSATLVEKNSFWSVGRPTVALTADVNASLSATGNYWGTTDESLIRKMIVDHNSDSTIPGVIEYRPFLTASDAATPTLSEAARAASVRVAGSGGRVEARSDAAPRLRGTEG
jgi:hypothetical protein